MSYEKYDINYFFPRSSGVRVAIHIGRWIEISLALSQYFRILSTERDTENRDCARGEEIIYRSCIRQKLHMIFFITVNFMFNHRKKIIGKYMSNPYETGFVFVTVSNFKCQIS